MGGGPSKRQLLLAEEREQWEQVATGPLIAQYNLEAGALISSLEIDAAAAKRQKKMLALFEDGDNMRLMKGRDHTTRHDMDHETFYVTSDTVKIIFKNRPAATDTDYAYDGVARRDRVTKRPGQVGIYQAEVNSDAAICTFRMGPGVRRRMERVCGATAYSHVLRNSEHFARYIARGTWISDALLPGVTGRDGDVKKIYDVFKGEFDPGLKERLSGWPVEVKDSLALEPVWRSLHGGEHGFLRFEPPTAACEQLREAYNIVVLGPTGCGK